MLHIIRCASLLCALPLVAAAASFTADATSPQSLTYSGDQSALDALDREVSDAGNDPALLAALETRLLALLRRTDTTFAARQAAAQRLGYVLAVAPAKTDAAALKPLAAMLRDERDSDLARLALDRAPGEVVDNAFATALEKTSGRIQLGLLDSIARRRIASAVPAVTSLLKHDNPATAKAAAHALGEIADPAAVAALHATPEPSAPAIAAAKLAAATRLPPAAALELLRELQRSARSPFHRAAAFRVSLGVETGAAAARIAEVLAGNDWTMKQVALEAVADSRAPSLVSVLTGKLTTWDAPTQAAALAALERRRDSAATPAIVAATSHKEAEVRAAAISALGALSGTRQTAELLAKIGASDEAADARLARQSLARLHGPEVGAVILAGAERGDPALRPVYIEQLALRNATEAIPLLLKFRVDPAPEIRAAAVSALGDIAPFSAQKALLDWTIEATAANEQSRALRSLVNVTLRNPDADARGSAIYALIEFAEPELVFRLLPTLGRMGGVASADSAARLALREDAKISEAATAALARWPDATALPALATVAEKAALPETRTAALEGALKYYERQREPWTPETTAVVTRLLAGAKELESRQKLVALLHRADDRAALALADNLKTDPDVGPAATTAAEVIRANLAGPPTLKSSWASSLQNILDGKTSTRWTSPALGSEWIEVDFQISRPLQRIALDQTGRPTEFPERYEVLVTDNPEQPGPVLASGTGERNKTVIELPAGTRGRYLILRNTEERKEAPWTIAELYVD